jgi:hypothetical protein
LIVSVADSIWQKQLQQMSPEFIFRINDILGHSVVDRIEFRIDPAAVDRVRSRIPAPRSSRKETRAPIPELISAASFISDSDLRDRFIRAAENCIERRESRMQAD